MNDEDDFYPEDDCDEEDCRGPCAGDPFERESDSAGEEGMEM